MTSYLANINLRFWASPESIYSERNIPEELDKISLVRLLEIALGHKKHAYLAVASYQLPGGLYLSASASEEGSYLSINNSLPESFNKETALLSSSEIELAKNIGQPVSVRAAWQEALFDVHLGAESVEFPCGPGIRCSAFSGSQPNKSLDLARFAPTWIAPEMLADLEPIHCLVDFDHDLVQEEIKLQAAEMGLKTFPGPHKMVGIETKGGHGFCIDSELVAYRSANVGYPLRLVAKAEIEQATVTRQAA